MRALLAMVAAVILTGCGSEAQGDSKRESALGDACVGGVYFDATGTIDDSRTCGALRETLEDPGLPGGIHYGCVGSELTFLTRTEEAGTCAFRCSPPNEECHDVCFDLGGSLRDVAHWSGPQSWCVK